MDSTVIAKHIAFKHLNASQKLTNLRLQSIMYLIQGYYLSITGDTLYPNAIYAWENGPAVPEVFMTDMQMFNNMAESFYDEVDDDTITTIVDTVVNVAMQYSDEKLLTMCNETIPVQFTTIGFVVDINKIKYFFQSNDILKINHTLVIL